MPEACKPNASIPENAVAARAGCWEGVATLRAWRAAWIA
jgi:hypothetical protein